MALTLKISCTELWLHSTLQCGQCFRWKEVRKDVWRGVVGASVITLDQSSEGLLAVSAFPPQSQSHLNNTLKEYFQLNHSLTDFTSLWLSPKPAPKFNAALSQYFKGISVPLKGLRLIHQDPFECLFSFMCAQNNNIKRISLMIENLCRAYGTPIGVFEDLEYFSFPQIHQMEKIKEVEFRNLGFGYRAKYFVKAVEQIKNLGGRDWLVSLDGQDSSYVKEQLLQISGIGPKVADCISLFSLSQLDIVPVDTHVFQIAQRYMKCLSNKKLTKSLHPMVADLFSDTFGQYSGWAHTILFAAELPVFRELMRNHGIVIPIKPKQTKSKKTTKKVTTSKERKKKKEELSSHSSDSDTDYSQKTKNSRKSRPTHSSASDSDSDYTQPIKIKKPSQKTKKPIPSSYSSASDDSESDYSQTIKKSLRTPNKRKPSNSKQPTTHKKNKFK